MIHKSKISAETNTIDKMKEKEISDEVQKNCEGCEKQKAILLHVHMLL